MLRLVINIKDVVNNRKSARERRKKCQDCTSPSDTVHNEDTRGAVQLLDSMLHKYGELVSNFGLEGGL